MQRFEFVDKSCVEMDMPFVIYCEHYNEYYYFKDTSKLQPAPLWNLIHVPPKSNTFSTAKTLLYAAENFFDTCRAELWYIYGQAFRTFHIHVWQKIWTTFNESYTCITLCKCNVWCRQYNVPAVNETFQMTTFLL